jgi:hypothetical protein
MTTPAFDALAAAWTGVARPVISNVRVVTDSNCAVTVTWTTSEAATTELQAGEDGRVLDTTLNPENLLLADDTVYRGVQDDTRLFTGHSATMGSDSAAPATASTGLKVAIRSTTADGRSASYIVPSAVRCVP